MSYNATCLECKNTISIEKNQLNEGDHFECPTCGITLEALGFDGQTVSKSEIVEMEK